MEKETKARGVQPRTREMLRTPLCDMLGCETPILLAGMGGIASGELVRCYGDL